MEKVLTVGSFKLALNGVGVTEAQKSKWAVDLRVALSNLENWIRNGEAWMRQAADFWQGPGALQNAMNRLTDAALEVVESLAYIDDEALAGPAEERVKAARKLIADLDITVHSHQ